MAITTTTRLRSALVAAAAAFGLALPGVAAAASTLPAAAPNQYNTTPACPVSPSDTVCAWNVPVDAGNLFSALDYGQCPYWAVEKYPALVIDELTSDPLANDWNGSAWLEHAQQEGLATSTTPASGDLAVWQATASDPYGHVAYVEAVLANGAIIVSQMDGASSAPFPALQGSTEYIANADLSDFLQNYGLEFISTGDPSTTPIADVVDLSSILRGVGIGGGDAGSASASTSPAATQAPTPVTSTATTPAALPTTTQSATTKAIAKKRVGKVRAARTKHARHTLHARRARAAAARRHAAKARQR